MPTFLVVDDHLVVREGCVAMLKSACGACDVFEADSGEAALSLVRRCSPDLIVMDVNLPGISGLETARRILRDKRRQRILFFSMYDELAIVKRALSLGPGAYISKNAPPQEFVKAVKAALRGDVFIQHSISMKIKHNLPSSSRARPCSKRNKVISFNAAGKLSANGACKSAGISANKAAISCTPMVCNIA